MGLIFVDAQAVDNVKVILPIGGVEDKLLEDEVVVGVLLGPFFEEGQHFLDDLLLMLLHSTIKTD